MLSIKKLNFILKNNKKLKFIFVFFLAIFFVVYITIPKLLNFSTESIKENLQKNNNIKINSILKVEYKIFPTPRLNLLNSNFTIGKEAIEVTNSEINIILRISQILNFKKINYKRLVINKGSSKINLDNIKQLLIINEKNKKKLIFRESKLIFFEKDKTFFEINDAIIKIGYGNKQKKLSVDGIFLNNKIFIKLENKKNKKNNLSLKIGALDISTKISFETNDDENIYGLLNLEVFNNFLKFNFVKGDSTKIIDGFIRSKLFNTSINGELTFKPNFYVKLYLKPTNLNLEKLFPLIQNFFLSDHISNLSLIKKINGSFNFKSKFEGDIIFKNGVVIFRDFKLYKDKSLNFSAKITKFGKKGKIQFNLVKIIQYNNNLTKHIRITGLIIPSNSKVIFEKFYINDNKLSVEKIEDYENKFKEEVIQKSLKNIFNENKLNKYFNSLM